MSEEVSAFVPRSIISEQKCKATPLLQLENFWIINRVLSNRLLCFSSLEELRAITNFTRALFTKD